MFYIPTMKTLNFQLNAIFIRLLYVKYTGQGLAICGTGISSSFEGATNEREGNLHAPQKVRKDSVYTKRYDL